MPQLDGKDVAHKIQSAHPQIGMIAYTMHEDEQLVIQLRKAGVRGYLLKGVDGEGVCKAVRVVHGGGEYYCAAIRERIDHLFHHGKLGPSVSESKLAYADVEVQIIKLICKERSCKEIADILQMNERTVEHHKERIQEKMGVQGVVGIAVYAMTNWLLY